ncbi:putative phenylacetic acid degradation protein [Gordonia polyisoprenivorans VH2]|uniref:Medium/long-chain acyl-CoA thioesterase YigI n=2 Tax=Gordonia polyisoprenivorans TaxID=84595 RepID=H6N3X6_GORPV|nr:PaaI family thioesterase [Gordonia polyisoprenivorans]AFA74799.1 putative phenylacetic acid degradation protein [Gordonia polyisoprenivorans VH2]NKY03299.1 PaaI family thioesterase [Gordonia polyisoprenivorans]OZC31783.1 PaaI family thioesterase [Gordonia polyisoprenivorans]WCB36318.1 PaaI family thioesterase [Gordonia polyisoprenivorans]GAB21787.1 hypothetical protein GOPIP_011_01790 [Gordonia polyisoprenivorans NBRC 16320 = JCM 10675]
MTTTTTSDSPDPAAAEAIRAVLDAMPAARALGFAIESLGTGAATLRLAVRPDHTQHTGHVQAGVLGALADYAAGAAVATLLPTGWANVTLDYTIKIVAPAPGPQLSAQGTAVSAGRTISVGRADIFDEDGNLCATALSTFRNVRLVR